MKLAIDYQIALNSPDSLIPSEQQCLEWLNKTVNILGEKKPVLLTVRIVEEVEIKQLNEDYRHKDSATNVLSFPYEKMPGVVENDEIADYLGDIIICASVVKQEALEQNKPLENHWAHMLIHGCLHLYGFDHLDNNEAEEMEALEIKILATLLYPNPYIGNTE